MELYERNLPLREIHWLMSLSFKEFKETIATKCKNDKDRKALFKRMREYCECNIKTKGEVRRIYAYSDATPNSVGGRLVCSNGIQGMKSSIRGLLFKHTTDFDMSNAHPVILRYLCRIHKIIDCQELNYYIENRNAVLQELGDEGKTEILKVVNDEKRTKSKNAFVKRLDLECKVIQKLLTSHPDCEYICRTVPDARQYNWLGSAINRILCVWENKILQVMVSYFNQKGLEIGALMYDGLMVYGDYYDAEMCQEIEVAIEKEFPGLCMKIKCKEHSNVLKVPADFQVSVKPETRNDEDMETFEKVSKIFEKNHCKIINKSVFAKSNTNDGVTVLSKPQIKASYEHLVYDKNEKGEWVKRNFINDWLVSNPNQRCYDDIGVYPPGLECPANKFNMWMPFDMELVTEWEHKPKELEIILNHISILCGNDKEVAEYFEKWIAQMIQFPAVKSICPTLISKQGAGKGRLLKLLSAMMEMGSSKVFETTSPSRDVWGDFNGRMCNTFLINLNELSKKETLDCEGKIKALITDPTLTINNKGVNQYEIPSFHRFIITTNNEEPVKTSNDDRRNVIIRSSDEKIGDREYFDELETMLNDANVIKTCYEYFKSLEGISNFRNIPMPETTYQSNLKELSISPIEQWLQSFVGENYSEQTLEMTGKETLDLFADWCMLNGVTYNINSVKLGVRLTNLNISGVQKGNHTKKGNTKIFNIPLLKKHFKMECIV